MLRTGRYGRTGVPPIPDVVFRVVEFGRYGGDVDAWVTGPTPEYLTNQG